MCNKDAAVKQWEKESFAYTVDCMIARKQQFPIIILFRGLLNEGYFLRKKMYHFTYET